MLVPTQPQPSYVLASTNNKNWEAPKQSRPREAAHDGRRPAEGANFDVDEFYDNVPCTD